MGYTDGLQALFLHSWKAIQRKLSLKERGGQGGESSKDCHRSTKSRVELEEKNGNERTSLQQGFVEEKRRLWGVSTDHGQTMS